MSKLDMHIARRIKFHDPDGQLDQTARTIQAVARISHGSTLEHMQRVALMAEGVAAERGWDQKAAFFGGLLHDIAKITLPAKLFDGQDITEAEYEQIKTHALKGFKILKTLGHQFTAMCAGLHHAMYAQGYGLTIEDFPGGWNPSVCKKVLELSAVISICDFIDAFRHRGTQLRDGSDKDSVSLKDLLYAKYPDDHHTIDLALELVIE